MPVVQLLNVAPTATLDEIHTLFSAAGYVQEVAVYPSIEELDIYYVYSRIGFVRVPDSDTENLALYMNNTLFHGKIIHVIPTQLDTIPEQTQAMGLARYEGWLTDVYGRLMPERFENFEVVVNGLHLVNTHDPILYSHSLPLYPLLPARYSFSDVEQIRRTILVKYVDKRLIDTDFFDLLGSVGPINATEQCQPHVASITSYFLVEYICQRSVIFALYLCGMLYKGNPIFISHARRPIISGLIQLAH